MENSKWSSNLRSTPYSGKQSLLPPKSPFPSIPPSYADYGSCYALGAKGIPRPQEGFRQHQRTSSESFLIEDQPSWVEELLDEPGTPVRRGHRRASSDSFAYVDANASNIDNALKEAYQLKNTSIPRGSQEFDRFIDGRHASFYHERDSFRQQRHRGWESTLSSVTYPSGHPSASNNNIPQSSGPFCNSQEPDAMPSTATRKQDQEVSDPHDLKGSVDRRDCSRTKPSASDTDPMWAKQQFAQRSRVRKLQYIAELERNVQALQAEGSEVSAEIAFLDKQNLFLNIKNKALKQRLDSLAEEHVIKRMEQGMLEREIARLQTLYQQQKQQLPPPHRRAKSRDLDLRFANLSLKHMEARTTGHDSANGGPLQI